MARRRSVEQQFYGIRSEKMKKLILILKVLFEEREIPIKSGSFNDKFAEYAVHIYEVY